MKYALISIVSFVCFALLMVIGPLQEVEIAHCVLAGLLGVVIALLSVVIYKLDKKN